MKKSSWERYAKRLYDEFKRTGGLSLDDKIKFDPKVCFQCGGYCCFDIDVILTPYDMYRLARGRILERLQMTFEDFVSKLCEVYIGSDSHLPIAKLGKDQHANCPFLAPVMDRQQNGTLKPRLTPDGRQMFLCGIHDFKPMKCRLFPAGIVSTSEGEGGMVYLARTDCRGCNTTKEITVRELLGPDAENLENSRLSTEVVAKASQLARRIDAGERFLKLVRAMLFSLLYKLPYETGLRGENYQNVANVQLASLESIPKVIQSAEFQQTLGEFKEHAIVKVEK